VRNILDTAHTATQAVIAHHAALYVDARAEFFAEMFAIVHSLRDHLTPTRGIIFAADPEGYDLLHLPSLEGAGRLLFKAPWRPAAWEEDSRVSSTALI